MVTVASVVLVLGSVLFVGWPLVRGSTQSQAADESMSPLERQKLEAYTAIKDAEFDYRLGKLSEDDFTALRERYRQQALTAIAAMEQERGKVRTGRRNAGAEASPAGRPRFCPDCGQRVPAAANFCGGCGRSVRAAVA